MGKIKRVKIIRHENIPGYVWDEKKRAYVEDKWLIKAKEEANKDRR